MKVYARKEIDFSPAAFILIKGFRRKERADVGKRKLWCPIDDMDRLFDAAVSKWGTDWNLDKLITAIKNSEG